MATATESKAFGVFDQAVSTFGESLKAGVKVQEEVAKWWTDTLEQQSCVTDAQKRCGDVVKEVIPAAQKNAEEWLKLIEKNAQKSIALLKRALETKGDAQDFGKKTQELWEDSLALARENAQAITQANAKMIELWSKLVKKNIEGNGRK